MVMDWAAWFVAAVVSLAAGALSDSGTPRILASVISAAVAPATPPACDQRERLGSACPLPADAGAADNRSDAPPGTLIPLAR